MNFWQKREDNLVELVILMTAGGEILKASDLYVLTSIILLTWFWLNSVLLGIDGASECYLMFWHKIIKGRDCYGFYSKDWQLVTKIIIKCYHVLTGEYIRV